MNETNTTPNSDVQAILDKYKGKSLWRDNDSSCLTKSDRVWYDKKWVEELNKVTEYLSRYDRDLNNVSLPPQNSILKTNVSKETTVKDTQRVEPPVGPLEFPSVNIETQHIYNDLGVINKNMNTNSKNTNVINIVHDTVRNMNENMETMIAEGQTESQEPPSVKIETQDIYYNLGVIKKA